MKMKIIHWFMLLFGAFVGAFVGCNDAVAKEPQQIQVQPQYVGISDQLKSADSAKTPTARESNQKSLNLLEQIRYEQTRKANCKTQTAARPAEPQRSSLKQPRKPKMPTMQMAHLERVSQNFTVSKAKSKPARSWRALKKVVTERRKKPKRCDCTITPLCCIN